MAWWYASYPRFRTRLQQRERWSVSPKSRSVPPEYARCFAPLGSLQHARTKHSLAEGQLSRPSRSAAGHTSGCYEVGRQQKGGRVIDLLAGTQAVARGGRSDDYPV